MKVLSFFQFLVIVDETQQLVLVGEVAVGVVGLVAVAARLLLLRKSGTLAGISRSVVGHSGTGRGRGGEIRGRVQEGQKVIGIDITELKIGGNFKTLLFGTHKHPRSCLNPFSKCQQLKNHKKPNQLPRLLLVSYVLC